ncbi:MAG: MFS transporter [Candidatus Hodarchaeota archaeon]
MLTHEKLKTKSTSEISDEIQRKIKIRKKNYVIFSLVYFIISLIQTYVIVYIPLFHFDVLNIDRSNLALIQVFSYLVLVSFPAFGFFFDKFSKYKTKIIFSFNFLLSLSYLIFVLYNQFLLSYAIFLAFYLISQAVIRTGMSKLLLESPDKKSERNIIILINTCSCIGILLPSILFKVFVKKIDFAGFWNNFFFVGWLITSPLLIILIFMRKSFFRESIQKFSTRTPEKQNYMKTFSELSIIFIFLAYFCIYSDKLIAYPFSSYIISRFGERGFSLYSDFYLIFIILNITGFYLANKLLKKIHFKEKHTFIQYKKILQNIVYLTSIYMFCFVMLLSSNIIIFLITHSMYYLISGIIVVLYATIFLQIARTGKNENLRYWIMSLSSNLASITLLPLGTFLSLSFSMEILIITVISLTSISIIFIYSSKFTIKSSK